MEGVPRLRVEASWTPPCSSTFTTSEVLVGERRVSKAVGKRRLSEHDNLTSNHYPEPESTRRDFPRTNAACFETEREQDMYPNACPRNRRFVRLLVMMVIRNCSGGYAMPHCGEVLPAASPLPTCASGASSSLESLTSIAIVISSTFVRVLGGTLCSSVQGRLVPTAHARRPHARAHHIGCLSSPPRTYFSVPNTIKLES